MVERGIWGGDWAGRVRWKLHCTKAMSLGDRSNTHLRKGKTTELLAPGNLDLRPQP